MFDSCVNKLRRAEHGSLFTANSPRLYIAITLAYFDVLVLFPAQVQNCVVNFCLPLAPRFPSFISFLLLFCDCIMASDKEDDLSEAEVEENSDKNHFSSAETK